MSKVNKNDHFQELKCFYTNANAVYKLKATCRNIIVENYREIRRYTLSGYTLLEGGIRNVHDTLHYKNTLFMCMLIDEDVEKRR